jgi:hypothetical protein
VNCFLPQIHTKNNDGDDDDDDSSNKYQEEKLKEDGQGFDSCGNFTSIYPSPRSLSCIY